MFVRALLALALLCASGAAWAGEKPLYVPAPDWVKPGAPLNAAALAEDDPMFLRLDQQQRLQDGQVWAYFESATRIASNQVLTQAGTLKLPWDPDKGDLMIHAIEILRGGERIDLLAAGQKFSVLQREEQLEQAALNGLLTATMAVEGLRVGDVLRVVFSMTRKDPALRGNVQTLAPLVFKPMPVKEGRLRILWPAKSPIRWKSYAGAGNTGAKVVEAGGYKELTVALPLDELAEVPGDAPRRYQPLPFLDVTSFASWAEVASGMEPLYRTEGTIAPGSPLAAEVAKIAAASSDPRTRAALALRLVQDKVRYLFRGMDGGNYNPQTPAHSWEVRYGDCKAKTLLLLAILRELKIDAEAALVSSQLGDVLPERLPMPGAFDHVIVRATIGGETLWLDGTGSGTRLADLADVPPFRHALALRATGAALEPLAMRPSARPDAEAELELDAVAGINFPVLYKIKVTFRGPGAEMLRTVASTMGKKRTDEMVDAMIADYLWSSQTIERGVRYDEESGTAVVTARGITYPDWPKEAGRRTLSFDRIVEGVDFAPDRARPIWADIPVATGDNSHRRVVTRMKLPDGGAGFALEGDQVLPPRLAGMIVSRKTTLAGGVLTVDDRTISGIDEIAVADIPATRERLAQAKTRLLKLRAPEDYPPRWRQIETARSTKAFDPLLAVLAKRIADEPDEVEPYTSRAWFLERIYDRQGALRDLDKAIALEPNAERYLWRARLWDSLGDDKKAIADVAKARELDPGSAGAVNYLATLQARSGQVASALAMVAERIAAGGKEKNDFVMLQAELLGDSGKAAEGVSALDAALASNPGNPGLLNSRCWLKGTRGLALDTALKDCTKSIELSDSSAHVLDSRAMVYFRMDRMEDALADLNAALEQQPELAASLYMRGVIRKRMGEAKAGDDDIAAAKLIAPRIDEDYAKYGIRP